VVQNATQYTTMALDSTLIVSIFGHFFHTQSIIDDTDSVLHIKSTESVKE